MDSSWLRGQQLQMLLAKILDLMNVCDSEKQTPLRQFVQNRPNCSGVESIRTEAVK